MRESTHCFDAEIYFKDKTCSMNTTISIRFRFEISISEMTNDIFRCRDKKTIHTYNVSPFLFFKNKKGTDKESENADLIIKKMLTQLICCD